jgi:O-succinylhomoserine sulfhydrylase
MKKQNNPETSSIRTQIKRSQHKEHSTPIYATSSFVFDSFEETRAIFAEEKEGYQYSRFSNPNNDELIEKLCQLEGVQSGVATASGMSSIFLALTSHLRAGDHIVASRSIFGSTHQILTNILPRWGITHTYVQVDDNSDWEDAIMPQTKLLFVETPSNPVIELCDLEFLGELANKHHLLLVVDNTFATPCLQNPALFGAHLICHSATKFIDGQGRTIGGAILGNEDVIKDVRYMSRQMGPCLSPFNSWILSKSLETLQIRMEKHSSNALRLAQYLEKSKEVQCVKYPFLNSYPQLQIAKKQMKSGGGLVAIELSGGLARTKKFVDNLLMISRTSNLGDSRSSITHPASTTHSKLTKEERKETKITDGLLRISVGLENIDDIIKDIEQAIDKTKKN